jgi:hypothetical protein
MVPLRPYLFGGGAAGALIGGVVVAFASITAVVSHGPLPVGARVVEPLPPATLNIGAPGRAPSVPSHGGGAGTPTPVSSHPPPTGHSHPGRLGGGAGGGPRRGPDERTQGARSDGAAQVGLAIGHPGSSGRGETPPGLDAGPLSPAAPPGHGSAGPPAGPPPGLAKKPSGLPPGLAKKPGGLPPGLAKKHD